MKLSWGIFFIAMFAFSSVSAQDTATLKVNAYVDAYYSFNFNEPVNSNIPYLVSSARHNEFSINLAMIDFQYQSKNIRARFTPGFGSYMNANYANEVGSFRNIVEATVGVKLSKKKNIWVDAGVMGAPIGYENAVSKNQLLYSRSLAAEGSPYFVSGVKLTVPLAKQLKGAVYVVNGWQQIRDVNPQKSVIGHLEFTPKNFSINVAAYYGNEQNLPSTTFGERFLGDFTIVYKGDETSKFKFSAGGYYGNQMVNISPTQKRQLTWFQANIAAQYNINKLLHASGRIEYFVDQDEVIFTGITGANDFNIGSASLGLGYKINQNALFRVEARNFYSSRRVYRDANQNITNTSVVIWASMVVNFGQAFKFISTPSTSAN